MATLCWQEGSFHDGITEGGGKGLWMAVEWVEGKGGGSEFQVMDGGMSGR